MVNRKDLWRFDFSTSAVDELDAPAVSVFPNPAADGMIYIKTIEKIEKMELVDLLGRTISAKFDLKNQAIETTGLKSGKYLLRITFANERVITEKVEILN
jgi:Secretion system C-terminal sorting domain